MPAICYQANRLQMPAICYQANRRDLQLEPSTSTVRPFATTMPSVDAIQCTDDGSDEETWKLGEDAVDVRRRGPRRGVPLDLPNTNLLVRNRENNALNKSRTLVSPKIIVSPNPSDFILHGNRQAGDLQTPPLFSQSSSSQGQWLGWINYALEIAGVAASLLKKPFACLLAVWIIMFVIAHLMTTIQTTLSPLCSIPGIFRLCPGQSFQVTAPSIAPEVDAQVLWADYPRLMDVESQKFELLLEETSDGPGLALEIKKAEMATSDLATLVRVSDLTSRDLLAKSLDEFVRDARKAGRGLIKFSSRVSGAVDRILAVNDYALHTIEAAQSTSSSSKWPSAIIRHFLVGEVKAQNVVTQTFTDAMNALSANMRRLVIDAEISLADLERLEQRLISLNAIISREDSSLSSAQSELLSDLWTRLGGNRQAVRGFEEHRALLRNIGSYRQRALA
ncbi:hypothetical protein FA95DRAFT_1682583, partial [Auriscalpium vulgare]